MFYINKKEHEKIKYIFISPHPDDAVWSCGGIIAKLADLDDEVIVINVFDNYQTTDEMKTVNSDFVSKRIIEDEMAMNYLRITRKSLSLKEATLRCDKNKKKLYPKKLDIFKIISAEDNVLLLDLSTILNKLVDSLTILISPLGIGKHVDHQIVYLACRQLNFTNTLFYAEFPYILYLRNRKKIASMHKIHLPSDPVRWLKASLYYQSQIVNLFTQEEIFIKQMKKIQCINKKHIDTTPLYYFG